MPTNEILTALASIVSLLVSSGTFVAIFQIRSSNAKTLAEAAKLKAEADQLKEQERVRAFDSQIAAANTLSNTYSARLDSLTDRIGIDEKEIEAKSSIIETLQDTASKSRDEIQLLKRKTLALNRLFKRLTSIIRTYLGYRTNILRDKLVEDPTFLKQLEQDLASVEEEYKQIETDDYYK